MYSLQRSFGYGMGPGLGDNQKERRRSNGKDNRASDVVGGVEKGWVSGRS